MKLPDQQRLGEIVFVVLGTLFSTRAFLTLTTLIGFELSDGGGRFDFAQWIPFIAYCLIGTSLVSGRRLLARRLFPDREPSSLASANSGEGIREFVVAAMGIWFISTGVVEAVLNETEILAGFSSARDAQIIMDGPGRGRFTSGAAWISRIPSLAEILVGILLFVSGGSIVDFWTRIRRAGTSR